jgi:hypothetical protein
MRMSMAEVREKMHAMRIREVPGFPDYGVTIDGRVFRIRRTSSGPVRPLPAPIRAMTIGSTPVVSVCPATERSAKKAYIKKTVRSLVRAAWGVEMRTRLKMLGEDA